MAQPNTTDLKMQLTIGGYLELYDAINDDTANLLHSYGLDSIIPIECNYHPRIKSLTSKEKESELYCYFYVIEEDKNDHHLNLSIHIMYFIFVNGDITFAETKPSSFRNYDPEQYPAGFYRKSVIKNIEELGTFLQITQD